MKKFAAICMITLTLSTAGSAAPDEETDTRRPRQGQVQRVGRRRTRRRKSNDSRQRAEREKQEAREAAARAKADKEKQEARARKEQQEAKEAAVQARARKERLEAREASARAKAEDERRQSREASGASSGNSKADDELAGLVAQGYLTPAEANAIRKDPSRAQSIMAGAERRKQVEQLVSSGYLTEEQVEQAGGNSAVLDTLIEIATAGEQRGVDADEVERLQNKFASNPSQDTLEAAKVGLVVASNELPPEAAESGMSSEQLEEFLARAAALGADDTSIDVKSDEVWKRILKEGTRAIESTILVESYELPAEAARGRSAEEIMAGMAEAQEMEGDATSAGYWAAYDAYRSGQISKAEFKDQVSGTSNSEAAQSTAPPAEAPAQNSTTPQTPTETATPAEKPAEQAATPEPAPQEQTQPQEQAQPSQPPQQAAESTQTTTEPKNVVVGIELAELRNSSAEGDRAWVYIIYADGESIIADVTIKDGEVVEVHGTGTYSQANDVETPEDETDIVFTEGDDSEDSGEADDSDGEDDGETEAEEEIANTDEGDEEGDPDGGDDDGTPNPMRDRELSAEEQAIVWSHMSPAEKEKMRKHLELQARGGAIDPLFEFNAGDNNHGDISDNVEAGSGGHAGAPDRTEEASHSLERQTQINIMINLGAGWTDPVDGGGVNPGQTTGSGGPPPGLQGPVVNGATYQAIQNQNHQLQTEIQAKAEAAGAQMRNR